MVALIIIISTRVLFHVGFADINTQDRIYVQSEDEPTRTLLESNVVDGNGYQKQQGMPWSILFAS